MEKKIRETYSLKIRTGINCPKWQEAKAKIQNKELFKTVISSQTVRRKLAVCIDTPEPENIFAFIEEVQDTSGNVLDTDDIVEIRDGEQYQIENLELDSTDQTGRIALGRLSILVSDENEASGEEVDEDVQKEMARIIEAGINTKEELEEKMQVFQENDIDKYLLCRILKQYRLYNKPVRKPACLYKDPYRTGSKEEGIVSRGLRAAVSRHAIICEGDKSVGKNVYVETIAWLMNKPLYLITFSRQMSPGSLYGEKTTNNAAAEELASFDSTILAKAKVVEQKKNFMMNFFMRQGVSANDMERMVTENLTDEEKDCLKQAARFEMLKAQSASVNIIIDQSELYDWLVDGGLMCFNEMNMIEANLFASFANQLLDGTGFLFIPGRGDVVINKGCVLFGTQNAEYQGTEVQNDATISRFGCIVFEQPKSIKTQLIASTEAAIRGGDVPKAKVDRSAYTQCENFYKQCVAAVNKGEITNACLNIRGFVRALQEFAESMGKAKLKGELKTHVINLCPVDDRLALNATLENIVTL